jgi:hypothetical protein
VAVLEREVGTYALSLGQQEGGSKLLAWGVRERRPFLGECKDGIKIKIELKILLIGN